MKEYKDFNDYELLYMVSENDENAKNIIYDKYKPLIIKLACEYYKKGKRLGLEIDDFIQEGYYGLYQSLSNFSEERDCLFYTYALRSIKSKMHNLCAVNATKRRQVLNDSLSLNMNISDDGEATLLDILEDKDSPNPWVLLDNYDFYSALKKYVYSGTLLEGSVLELKINGFSIISISELLGETRHVVEKALFKVKQELKTSLR